MAAPGHLVKVELGLGSSPFTLAPVWTDMTAAGDVQSVAWTAGRQTPTGTISSAAASVVVDNATRVYDPLIVANVRPNIPVRISLVANSNLRRRFYGFVDAASITYGFPQDSLISFTATDGQKFVARETNLGLGDVVSEVTSARLTRVLDAIGWPATWRDIETGSATMAAASLDTDAMSALTAAVQAEGVMSSAWFIDRSGNIRFDARHAVQTRARMAAVQASFSNIEADVAGAFIGYSAVVAGTSEATVSNKATVTAADGVAASAADTTSVTNHGPLRFPSLTHTAISGSRAAADASTIVNLFGTPTPAVSSITVSAVSDGADFDTLAQLELRDRIRVKLDHPSGGTVDDQEYFIESIAETASTSGRWEATYGLSPAGAWTALGAGGWLVVGDATLGLVGTGKVGI